MFKTIRKLLALIDRRERAQAAGLLALIILMAFVEVLGIASILPFMAVLSNPEVVETNRWLRAGYEMLGFESVNRYLFFLGLVVLFILIASNTLKAVTRWATLHFSFMCGHLISKRLFTHYLNQPYSFFLERNSAHLSKNVLSEVQALVQNIFIPMMDLLARALVTVTVLGFLLFIDPLLAVIAAAVLGGAYAGIYLFFNKRVRRYGRDRQAAQGERYKIVNEAILGIKNIKLTAHEATYCQYYEAPSHRFADSQSKNGAIGEVPRYALEIIGFGGILLIILYLLLAGQGLAQALPLMALYALAGYRLMPNLQAIYAALNKLRFSGPILENITSELTPTSVALAPAAASVALPFRQTIRLSGIRFRYANTERDILNGIDLEIPANSTVGIVGKTGSGKTTLVDIILGLLRPTDGTITIDGVLLTDDYLRAWQQNLAYVSQHIYLCDDTVRQNIAFGTPDTDIDEARIRDAARMACLDRFIEDELPNGYDTIIGENGIRLSGGQRQRLGLARALYLNRPVLVLDEATSALDSETEDGVMAAIERLGGLRTIIMIAHRAGTLKICDFTVEITR